MNKKSIDKRQSCADSKRQASNLLLQLSDVVNQRIHDSKKTATGKCSDKPTPRDDFQDGDLELLTTMARLDPDGSQQISEFFKHHPVNGLLTYQPFPNNQLALRPKTAGKTKGAKPSPQ